MPVALWNFFEKYLSIAPKQGGTVDKLSFKAEYSIFLPCRRCLSSMIKTGVALNLENILRIDKGSAVSQVDK